MDVEGASGPASSGSTSLRESESGLMPPWQQPQAQASHQAQMGGSGGASVSGNNIGK